MLITQIREKVDLVQQVRHEFEGRKEVMVLKDSLNELNKLDDEGVEEARLALENIIKQKIKVVDNSNGSDVDSKLLKVAGKQNAFIATNDKLLRKRAENRGVPVLVYNKSKKKLIRV